MLAARPLRSGSWTLGLASRLGALGQNEKRHKTVTERKETADGNMVITAKHPTSAINIHDSYATRGETAPPTAS